MLNLSCFVVYFSLVTCLAQKKLQHELKGLTKKESFFITPFINKVDGQNMKYEIMDKLKTVEADPLYDYKDMWWKTMRRIQSTEPTIIENMAKLHKKAITKEKNAAITKTSSTKRITEAPRVNIGVKTKTTKAYKPRDMTRMKKLEADKSKNNNLLSDVKPMNAVDVTTITNSPIGNITKKNVNIDDYVYSDVLFKQNKTLIKNNKDPLKDILLTNDSKVISDIQAADVSNLIKIYNGSKNAMKDIAGINATNLINYYNFTAMQFGDAALQNQNHVLLENYETKSTWRLIKPGHTEWLHPTDQNPYSTEPTATTESPADFITFLMVYKKDKNEGYFSTFLTHLFYIISEKPEKDVRLLCLAMAREYNVLTKQNKFIHDFGPAFLGVLHDFSVGVAQSPAEYIKAYASLLYNSIPNRKETINTGVTSIIDYIDTLFNDNEGTALFKALELVNEFPNTTENAYDILRTVSKALFAPYLRWSGTIKAQILINSINNEIKRAHGKSVVGRENTFRNGEMKDQRRLGIFTNKTRFAVVNRELSDSDDNNKRKRINKDKHRKNTLNKSNVKKKHDVVKEFGNAIPDDVYEKTTAEYNTFKKHIARFKIVTREPDIPKHKPHLFIRTTKYEEQKYPKEKKHPKMYGKHTKHFKKNEKEDDFTLTDVFKNIYKSFIYFSRNITVTKHPVTKRTTGRTVKYSKSKEDNRDATKRKTTKVKPRYTKMPLKNVTLVNKFGIGPTKQTERKKHKKPNKKIIESKYELDEPDYKSNKKTDKRQKVRYYNAELNKVTGHSSYSYEENDLKFRLHDALNHDAVYDKNFRKHNMNPEKEKRVDLLSSYSNEEATIKSNIYKVIGFNHVARNASFDGFPQRRTNINKNMFAKGVKFKPVDVLSSYEDEEGVIKERLYD